MIILSCPCYSGLRPEFLKDQRFLIIKTASIPEETLSAASFFAYRPQTAGVTAIMELKPCVLTFSYTFIFKYELPLNILMLPLFISVYWNFKLIPLGMPFLWPSRVHLCGLLKYQISIQTHLSSLPRVFVPLTVVSRGTAALQSLTLFSFVQLFFFCCSIQRLVFP